MPTPPNAADPLWYRDAVIYQVHIKAFADSNGDGIGDFRGLIDRLDYLQRLGVTAIWLLPFYPSPLRDDGYDIADYDSVNPKYGTMADFEEFLAKAHERGLRVITELVINHTSDRHAWFQRARRAPKGSPERQFYVWSDTPEPYAETRIIFEDFEESNWTWDPVAQQYYWHRFYAHQPDLNFDHPAVHEAVFAAMDRWLDLGVDGIRLDAIPYLYEREGTNCENLRETHDFLKLLRRRMDDRYPGRMFLAEANQWPEDTLEYFGDGDECHTAFHFPVMPRLYMALAREDYHPITDILEQTPPIPATCQWVMFLRNHDELTLEMVTDEERVEMRNHYAPDPQMRINAGIRRRLAPLMGGDRRRIELMNALLFSMPGTPVLYYGDEIGMGDDVSLPDRDGVRTPMQWSSATNAGFSTARPSKLYAPVITDGRFHYTRVNVADQIDDPSSHWSAIRRLIERRTSLPLLGRGGAAFLQPQNQAVLAFLRTPPPGSADDPLLVVANLSGRVQQVSLELAGHAGQVPVDAFGGERLAPIGDGAYAITLAPYGYLWLQLVAPRRRARRVPAGLAGLDRGALTGDGGSSRLATAIGPWLTDQPWWPSAEPIRGVTALGTEALGGGARLAHFEVDTGRTTRRPVTMLLAELDAGGAGPVHGAAGTAPIASLGPERLLVDGSFVPAVVRGLLPRRHRPPVDAPFTVSSRGSETTSELGTASVTVHHVPATASNERTMHEALRSAGFRRMSRVVGDHADGPGVSLTMRVLPVGQRLGADLSAPAVRAAGLTLGRFHRTLAGIDDPAFTPQPFTSLYQRALYQGIYSAAKDAGRAHPGLDIAPIIRRVEGLRRGTLDAARQRIHGDVRLDSFIWDGSGASITGYGGEPGRPAEEQALKRSPLRDIAQMLCAIDDAAPTAAARRRLVGAWWDGYFASGAQLPGGEGRALLVEVFVLDHRLAQLRRGDTAALAPLTTPLGRDNFGF